jgi:hypothetical protein
MFIPDRIRILISFTHPGSRGQKGTRSATLNRRQLTLAGISKVLSCEPYSSAFCAMSPTLETWPVVCQLNCPCSLQTLQVCTHLILLRLLGHEPHVRHVASRLPVELTVLPANIKVCTPLILLRLLGHEPHVRHVASRLPVELPVLPANITGMYTSHTPPLSGP